MLKSHFHTPKRRTEDCPRNAFELRGLICVSEGEKGKNILSRKKETRLDFLICLPFSFHIKPLCLPFACLNSHDHVMEVGKVNRLVVFTKVLTMLSKCEKLKNRNFNVSLRYLKLKSALDRLAGGKKDGRRQRNNVFSKCMRRLKSSDI